MTAGPGADTVTAPPPVGWRSGPRLFATPADEPRARRAGDGIALVGSALGLAILGFADEPAPGFSKAVTRLLRAVPGFFDGAWQFLADALVFLALGLLVAASLRRRGAIVRDQVVAVALAAGVWLVVGRMVMGGWPELGESLRAAEPPPWFPSPRLALPAAVIITTSPHLALPLRRLGRWLVALAGIAVIALGATSPLGAIGGLLVAAFAAAAVHLAFGSCSGRPGLGLVRDALVELGVPVRSLGAADRQQAGVFVVHAIDEAGDPLIVKVYGRDAHDTALVSALGRTVWFRDPGAPVRLGRLQQVEHEAFATLMARQHGVVTDTVVTAGATTEGDAVLVLRRTGRPLDRPSDPADGADLAGRVWELVRRLQTAGIAHGQLDARHLLTDGYGELGVWDFRGATVAASEGQRRSDEVQAFVTTVLLAGEDAAVAAASEALGPEGLAATLPYLQPSVLTARQRRELDERGLELDDLRSRAAAAAGVEPPALVQLRRITLASLGRVLLPALAVFALLSQLAGLDLEQLADLLADATWWLVAVAVIATQLPRVTQAVSTLGASPVPLPLGPVYALQLAVSYVNIAIPTAAARIAVNIRFFQRHGVPPSAAVAAGALDGASGFIVQALILVGLLVFTPASLDLRVGEAAASAWPVVALALAIGLVGLLVVVAIGRFRTFVWTWARRLGAEGVAAVRGLRSPRRLALLFGGNLASEVLFAASLGLFARAFGFPVGLDELLLINISVGLLAGLLPVPGGVGVTEGGITFGLVQAGLPEEVALATALIYRLSSFYLPPIWGFFALRWLERRNHL